MRNKNTFESGLFIPRILLAVALCLTASLFTILSFASNPSSGTLSPSTPVLNYTVPPPHVINQSPLGAGQVDKGPRCNTEFPCDSYALTVNLPSGYHAQYPNASIRVTMGWVNTDPTNNVASDYDLYIYPGVVASVNGSQAAPWSSASQNNPEVANISPVTDGTTTFTIFIVAFQPANETVNVKIELLSGSGGNGFPGFGSADPTTPGVPRYQIFDNTTADAGQNNGQGEFNIGYNNTTKRIMAYNGLQANLYRVTPAEIATPGKPECCPETWTQKAPGTFVLGLDPILWTDNWTDANPLPMQPASGARTFVANSTAGTNEAYAVTDNDGDTYLPTNASPPNASSDHETIGSGPYPPSLGPLVTPVNHGHAIYYCAQTYPVGAAACQRSDNYGDSYGASTLPYTGNAGSLCGGIHGHVHVGPDGTVYLPVRDCSGNAGLAVSLDAGVTWTQYAVPNSAVQTHGSDPSVAIGANNTVYFFYVKGNADQSEGHVHVQVSTDHGAHWSKDTDLGAAAPGQGPTSHGVINSAFPEAVAGDDNRAACGFLGTDRPGSYESLTFPGYWYLFIATTYDGGNTWNVVNATPNDPVQGKGGIWQGGGSGVLNRNLLDFNEVTMDEKGRVLFGYSDGCTGACVGNPDNNTFRAAMRVARQIGGKPLFSAFDPNPAEPAVPKAPCLSGTRNASGVHLTWKVPDNGGANITGYRIFRGTASGNEVFLTRVGTKGSFDDITADPSLPAYYYVRALNGVDPAGGAVSQEVNFPPTPGIWLQSVSSRKSHGPAGDLDINLPFDGSGIECRMSGYTMVFRFADPLGSVTGASVTSSGTGNNPTIASRGIGTDPHEYAVNLSNVPNAQYTTVALTGITDSAGHSATTAFSTMGVLVGDVTANGVVTNTDVGAVKAHVDPTTTVTQANCRYDVSANGFVTNTDVGITKAQVNPTGGLPPAP